MENGESENHVIEHRLKAYKPLIRLPGWPVLGQISKLWPRFQLVGLKILVGLLAFFWPSIKLVGLKKYVWPFGSFLAFFAEIGSYE